MDVRSGTTASADPSRPASGVQRSDNALLRVDGVSKSYGGLRVLMDVGLDVGDRELVSLIGSNGAGKTTLFNIITRLEHADGGSIVFDRHDLTKASAHSLAGLGIARTFQHSALFPSLSVEDNIAAPLLAADRVGVRAAGFRFGKYRAKARARKNHIQRVLADLKLRDVAQASVVSLPYATQRRVEIARAVAMRPKLLILDEPAGGLNKSDIEDLEQLLQRLRHEYALSLLLIEHNMRFVMRLSDYIYVLDHGELIAHGDAQSVSANQSVIDAYLGQEPGSA